MEPSKKYISSEDLKRLNLISKILKLQNSQLLNTCREDLQLNGYLPDIDAEQSSMFETENLEESEDSVDYYHKLLSHGSLFSLHQPLELLVNTLTNSLLPTTKVKSCSGRASTSSVKNTNSGRTSSLGTAPIRTKPPTAGSVAGRASLSTEEKQAKRSGVGFFHRTNDRFYSRSSGFESSSGSDETSSSTAGDETDDEGILQRNRQNRSQSTKRMQPITYMSRASQGRKNTVRNGSLPNRPTQKEITSRTSANSINKSLQKPSASLNSLTTKPRSTSTSKINSQRKGKPIINPVQTTTTTMRASSTNLGANKTSGKVSVQKAQNAEKAPQREKPSTTKNILLNENVQQAREKEIATLGIAPTLNRIISTPYGRSEPQNYTTEEKTNECQEALTLAKNAGGEKEKTQSCFSDTNKKEHSQRNQSKEMEHSMQKNKGNENNLFMPTTTTDGNMNNYVNPPLNNPNSYSQNVIPSTSFMHRLTPEEEQRQLFEDAAEVLKQHAYPSETHNNQAVSPVLTHNQVNEHQNSTYYLNQRSHVEEFSVNSVALNAVNQNEQYRQTYQQDNISQRPNSQLRMHPSNIQSMQQQQHQQSPPQIFSQSASQVQSGYPQQIHQRLHHQSPPQIFSQSTAQSNSGYLQQIQQHQQSPPQMFLRSASQDNSVFSQQNQQQSQHLVLQQQHYSPPQHLSQPSSQENRGFHHQYQQQQSQTPGYQQQQQHYESPPQHLSQPTSLDNRGYHQQQLMVGTSPSFQQVSPPQQQHFKPPTMYPQTNYDVSTTMPPAVPLSSSQTYSNQNFHTFQQQNNISTRLHLSQNWINHSPSDYHVSTISGVPPEVLQNGSNSNAISLNHHSPQIFNQQSPQHRPPQRRSNPSASIQHHRQQPYSSPSETQNYINSPATPMSNPRPSPLPPPYPQNNGQSNFSNGVLSSANIANVNSTLLQEQRIHQQRIWEQQKLHHQQQQQQQQQQQIMMQQIPWQQQSPQFRNPQHPHHVSSGPGMYSVPPNRYGYPTPTVIPTIPETPTKAAIPETPPKAAKATTKKKTPELNRLLNAPPDRLPIVQHPMQSVRPQMFQQHYQTNAQPISRPVMMRLPHQGFAVTNPQMNQQQQQANPNNLQQQYYMIPANQPQTMQMVSLQQQYIRPHQPLPSSSQQQPLHFSQTGTLPQHVQFQQLNISSPQQIRQPMSQPENVTMSPQQQSHFSQFTPQQQQRTSQIHLPQASVQQQNAQNQSQQQYIQPRYSNPASEPLSANVISSKLNSPYSNGPNSFTPNFTNTNFYSSNDVPINGSPDNFEFSPTNPKLPNRLTTFNTTLICNPNGALSPFTSPSNITTITPSPPKTPQLKRPYNTQSSNNDGNGDISKKKKDSSSTQNSPFIQVTTSSSHSYSIPPSISSFQVQHQASSSSATTDNPVQNVSYTTASNQQESHPQKNYYPEELPIPGAEKYYATLRANQAKDAFVNEVSTQNAATHIPNMAYESNSLNPSYDSNIAANVEMITPTNPEEIIFSEQNAQFDDIDPLEEFLDLEVANETAPSFSMQRQDFEAFESGEINETVTESSYETNVIAESNSQREEVLKLSLIPESSEVNVNAEQNVSQNGESNRNFVGTNYVADVAAENSPQIIQVFEETVNPNSEKREVAPSEDPDVEKQQEIEININNEEELEEGEIVESDEEMSTVIVEIENKKEKAIKRSREFETDEMPIVEEKRPKISTELNNIAPLNILGNKIQKETEELLLVSESSAQNVDEIVEESQRFEDISDEEGLLADSPIKDTVDIPTDSANHERNESEALANTNSVENVSQTSESIEINNEELLLADFQKPDSVTKQLDQNIESQESVDAVVEDIGCSASNNIVENNEELFSFPKISEINANSVENINETIDEESLLADCKVTDSIEINFDRNAEKLDEINAIIEVNVSSHATSMNAEEADEGLLSPRKLSENNINSVKIVNETNDESQRFQGREISAEELLSSDSPLKDVVSTPADFDTEEFSQSVTLSANVEEDISHSTASNGKQVNGEELLLLNGLQINDKISITDDCNIDECSETAITAKNVEEIDEAALLADSPKKDAAQIDANCNIQELYKSEALNSNNDDIVSPPAAFETIEANDEEMLLANSPELQTSLSTVMNNLKENEDSSQSNIDAVKSIMNSEIENDKAIDEEILSAEMPIEAHSNLDVEILELNQGVNEIVLDESNNDIEMAELIDDENDTTPSYEELLQSCGEEINTENSEEMLSKFGANAAMNAATEICTLNVIRNEVHKVISDISATSSIERTVMVNLVQDIFDLQLEEVKGKNLAVINVLDKQSQKLVQKRNLKPGRRYEGAIYEIMIPLYTAAIKWEKEENKSAEFYENIKYVKKLLLSMVANLGKNDDTNLWHELFTLQIFSTPQRVKILYQLLTKSINICNFLNDFIALVIDLFSITQCAACLFIKDYNDLKKIDSNLALVVIEAVNRVRDLTPEMRSQLVFKFQIRIYQFLEKFEHSNISPEAHAFVSSLSWDAKTLSDSRDLPKGYLPISEPMNPSVEKIFKKSLKHLNKSGVIKVKGWSYNFAKSVLQSNFMTTIIRDSENLEKKVQEAFLAEIIPTLLKLALSLPHLFVASDPYHQLELIPTLFEDSAPILNKANEDIHEQMIVPFMPFATIMESIKRHNSPSTESLLKSCHRLFVTLKNAPNNIPEAIQAERRRCSNKLLYEKIHREYVRRQMAKSDIEKFQNDEDKLDLKHLHSMASKLFTTKSLEVPPKIIAGIKEGDREAVSTEKVFRSKMMDACCNVLKTILDSITIEQKLEFMIDHPLLNEKLKIADILNVHQFGKDSLGCFTAFIGLLSLPNNKILGDPKSSTFFNAIKQRRDAIFYFALKNSALIKNNKPTVSTEILEKDIPIYDILMKIFLTAEMKRNLCCPDNVSTYLYFALIINDISNVDIEIASEHLFEECGINENQVPFFATFNYANDLEAKIEKVFNDELETLVKDISSRISVAGIPRIIYDQLSNCQTKINELKCLVIQLVATFWNPQKLLYAVGITLECRKKLEIGIEEIGKLLITGFFHLGKRTVKVEDLEAMILEEMDHIRGECLMSFQNSSLYGLILHIQQLFGFDSVVSALLIVLYVFTISNEKQLYAHRISLAFKISRESNLLKIFGLKNSEFGSIGIIDKKHQVVEMEKLFEEDYILHAAEVDPSIFFMFLDKPLNIQYKELMFALQSECNGIKHRFQFHVNNQRLRYHPKNIIQREPASDTPLIGKFPKNMFFKSTTKEVPANFCYPR